ncbi:MAG: hypothetical protein HQK62_08335 [Desulfamplus sp.]|nr:hypothetical protein [Desulfamplus sp.]
MATTKNESLIITAISRDFHINPHSYFVLLFGKRGFLIKGLYEAGIFYRSSSNGKSE